jgi:hypothetical protein
MKSLFYIERAGLGLPGSTLAAALLLTPNVARAAEEQTAIECVFRGIFIGAGATLVIDAWAALLRRFGIPSLNFAMLGRWIGHLRHGRLKHQSIAKASPVRRELLLGWAAHYAIGISFAGLLLAAFGLAWARSPTLGPALLVGVGTVVAPLFILQPALGAGIASSKTPTPVFNTLKSLTTHVVFGVGLFVAAVVAARLFPSSG